PVQGGGGEQQAGERDPLARGGRAERGWGRRRQAGDGDGVGRNGHGTSSPTGAGAFDAVGAGVAGWCPAGSDRRTAPAGPRAATAAPPSGVTDYARGRWTVNSVRPGRLVAVTVPPWAAVTARTIARPRPVLPVSRDREVEPRANRSKMCGSSSGAMPGPSSATDRRTSVSCGARVTVTVVPGGVWARALASRFASTWASREASPGTTTGSSGTASCQVCPGPA